MEALLFSAAGLAGAYLTTKQSVDMRNSVAPPPQTPLPLNKLDSDSPQYKNAVDKQVLKRATEGIENKLADMSNLSLLPDDISANAKLGLYDNSKYINLSNYNNSELQSLMSRSKKETYDAIESTHQGRLFESALPNNVNFVSSNREALESQSKSATTTNKVVNEEAMGDNRVQIAMQPIKFKDVEYKDIAGHLVDTLVNPIKGVYEQGIGNSVAAATVGATQALGSVLSVDALKFDPSIDIDKLKELADILPAITRNQVLASEIVASLGINKVAKAIIEPFNNFIGVMPTNKNGGQSKLDINHRDALKRNQTTTIDEPKTLPSSTGGIYDSHRNINYIMKSVAESVEDAISNRNVSAGIVKSYGNELTSQGVTSALTSKEKTLYRPFEQHKGFVNINQIRKDPTGLTTTLIKNNIRNNNSNYMGQASKINMQSVNDRNDIATKIVRDITSSTNRFGGYSTLEAPSQRGELNQTRTAANKLHVDNELRGSKPPKATQRPSLMTSSGTRGQALDRFNFSTQSNKRRSNNFVTSEQKQVVENINMINDANRPLDVFGMTKRFQDM